MVFPGKEPGSDRPGAWSAGQPTRSRSPRCRSRTTTRPGIRRRSTSSAICALAIEKVGYAINAIDPDLRAFKARGGKLLLYHGWNDGLISAGNTVDYYDVGAAAAMGAGQDDWLRLFMVPGMGHCQGGAGPDQVNWMAPLERWRESGKAPDRIDAARVVNNRIEMTRPLCPYPQIAQYTGVGSTNDADNFVCKAP